MAAADPADIATLIYTSGTTGPPKGVMLSVANVEFAIKVLIEEGAFTDPPPSPKDLLLSYLPLSHVAERIFSTWFNAAAGTQVNFAESIDTVPQNLREVQPTILFGVPRIWEKLLAGVETRLNGATPAQARARPLLATRSRTRSANDLVATGGNAHDPDPAALRRRLGVLLPRAQGASRHAPRAVRRLRCRADRARRPEVLHGHRRAHARGLRHDREHRRSPPATAPAACGSAPSGRCTPASR